MNYKLLPICAAFIVAGFSVLQADPMDYSDAAGYDAAWNSNPTWQRLGTAWDAESGPLADDPSDDGVWWSLDGGATWGHDEVAVGQTVTLRFDMYKYLYGIHDFDALRAWIDFDQNEVFDADELVIEDQWDFISENLSGYRGSNSHDAVIPGTSTSLYLADASKSFYTTTSFDDAGDYWLRARVNCSADIQGNFANMNPYGHIWQGETEDWKISVASVPEPASLSLFAIGFFSMIGMGWVKRTKK